MNVNAFRLHWPSSQHMNRVQLLTFLNTACLIHLYNHLSLSDRLLFCFDSSS